MNNLITQVSPIAMVERVAVQEQNQGVHTQLYLQQAALAEGEKQRSLVQKTEADEAAHKLRAEEDQDSGNAPEQNLSHKNRHPEEQSDPDAERPSGKDWVGVILNTKA